MKSIAFLLCSILFLSVSLHAQKRDKALKTLDALFTKSLTEFNVPGMSVAIVENGKTIFEKGYGVKSTTTNELVDANSLFAIASNSKAFTSAALAMLVDEGKISWNDKVRNYLPYFQLYSPYVSDEMTVRDLLCHRSGLETFSGDLIWYGTTYSRKEIIERAKFLEPKYGFRAQWGYSNIMFLAAGEIVAEVSGMSWDEFIRQRFFLPLEMNTSNTSTRAFTAQSNKAMPHNEVNGKNMEIPYINWDNIGAAGAINSSVSEMTQWLILQLGKGTLNGKKYWDEARTWEMWDNQIARPVSKWQRENMPSRHWNGYGLGWELMEYEGHKIVSHGGGYDGMISKTLLVPDMNLGFVILTNNINSLPSLLTYEILDEFIGVKEQKDWFALFMGFKKEGEEADKQQKLEEEKNRVKDSKPSLPIEKYCGTYSSEMYGDVVIEQTKGSDELRIDFKPTALFKATLTHWHYDTFELTWSTQMMLPKGKVTFVINAAGIAEEMKVDVPNPDFDFGELKLVRKVIDK